MKKTLICVLVISIMAAFFLQTCVMCNAAEATEPHFSYADVNNDGFINMKDIMILANAYNTSRGDSRYILRLDLNDDGAINMADVIFIARYFNRKANTPTPAANTPTPKAVYDFDASTGTIIKYNGSSESVTIPNMINGANVICIGKYAFAECKTLKNITIPEGVGVIEDYAFYKCGLEGIELPDGLGYIGNEAFRYCTGLTDMVLPICVSTVGRYAFSGCSLTGINIPYNMSSIQEGTFADCRSLKSITMPDSMTSIGKYAFDKCSGLTSVTITKNVETIDSNAFNDCPGLNNALFLGNQPENFGKNIFINVKEDFKITVLSTATGFDKPNPYNNETSWNWSPNDSDTYKVVINNEDYDFDAATGTIKKYIGKGGDVSIPDMINGVGVTAIGVRAFFECSNITSVAIPDSVTAIGEGAFALCSNLQRVTIPHGVTRIENAVFATCPKLAGITIPDGVTSIGDAAFADCSSIKDITIPASVKSIGNVAFAGCSLSNAVFMGDQPTFPDWTVFANVSEDFKFTVLPTATGFGKPDPYNNEIYWTWNAGGPYTYRVFILETSVIEEGDFTFGATTGMIIKYNGTSLETVVIPDEINGVTVTGIGSNAFYRSYISNIQIPQSVTYIGDYAFYGCISLEAVELPKGLKILGKHSFGHCSDMRSITMPDRLDSIEAGTFAGCTDLSNIPIPEGVTSIGNNAFQECGFGDLIIPEGVTSIGSGAFHDSYIKRIVLPTTLVRIGSGAFSDSSLTSITIPEGVICIEEDTFSDSNLASITIPDSVEAIGNNAFADCSNLKSITLPKNLYFIGPSAFDDSSLTSIIIPKSVSSIEAKAFRSCNNLSNALFLGDQPSVFEEGVFDGVKDDFKITVSSTAIGFGKPEPYNNENSWNWALNSTDTYKVVIGNIDYDIDAATGIIKKYMGKGGDVRIPNMINGIGVTAIGEGAFAECLNLQSAIIPDSVTSLEMGAFANCPNLSRVTIPNTVTSIGETAFVNCSSLKNIKLPDSITTIGAAAFYKCGLTDITIPEGVKSIGDVAFAGCPLSNALFLGDQPTFAVWTVFDNVSENFKITVLRTTTGFGKPEPYNNERSWEWNPLGPYIYKVFILEPEIN